MKRALTLLYAACGLSLIGGIILRILHFNLPNKVVFDEVYFPVMANDLLHGKIAFDAHPPLGKWIMAAGIHLFGHNSFGDRIVILLFGLALIALCYFLGRRYFAKDEDGGRLAGLLLATFAALDCMLIVYSRLGLMDSMLLFFVFVTFFMALKVESWLGFVGLAVLLGVCPSIKWLAIAVIVPVAFILWRRGKLGKFFAVLPISVLVYVAVVLSGGLLQHDQSLWDYFVWWHKSVWGYETTLTATHPWGSLWYTWPIMNRPLLMMRDTNPDGTLGVINAIGNPLLWYASTVAVAVSWVEIAYDWVKRRPIVDNPMVPLLLGWAAFFVAWIPIHRVLFIYHYLPSYGFALMLLAYWLLRLWRKQPWYLVGFVVVAFVLTLFFAQELVGWWHISQAQLQLRVWFPGWI